MMYNIHYKSITFWRFEMRLNITITEDLKYLAEKKAKSLGISISALIRLLLAKETGRMSKIDQRLLKIGKEDFESFSMKALRKDIENAKT